MKKFKFLVGAVVVVGAIDAALAYRNYLKKKGINLKAAFLKGGLHSDQKDEHAAEDRNDGHNIPIDWQDEDKIFAD